MLILGLFMRDELKSKSYNDFFLTLAMIYGRIRKENATGDTMAEKKFKNVRYYLVKIIESFLIAGLMNLSFYYSMINFINNFRGEVQDDVYLWGFWILLMIVGPLSLLGHGSAILLALLGILCVVTSLVNYYEVLFRGTVLVYQDYRNIGTAGEVIGNYHFPLDQNVIAMLVCFSLILATILAAEFLLRKTKAALWSKIAIVIVDFALFFNCLFSENNILPEQRWSWEQYYLWYGFVVGTAANLKHGNVQAIQPQGYAADAIELLDPIVATSQEYPDIILILNETYYDLNDLLDLETDIDFMENYRNLEGFKGHAAVPVVGGGTNDSEYELLTGNSISLLNTYSPFNNLNFTNYVSIVKYLKDLGYYTMALHPSYPSNYHRQSAWKQLGFDESWFESDFDDLEFYGERPYATDRSVFKNLQRFYESMPDHPRFTFCITIQNHGDWTLNQREYDNVFVQNEYSSEELDEYLTSIKMSDEAIQDLVEYFGQSSRPVIVCMVGDHAPSLVSYYALGIENEHLVKRQVPYFIWSNSVDLIDLDLNHELDLCALTPYIMYAGGLPLCPYYANILELSQSIQCFTNILEPQEGEQYFNNALGFILTNGELHHIYEDSQDARLLRNYFYSEYNLISDKNRKQGLIEVK